MNRISEDIAVIVAKAPASLASATEMTSDYISAAGRSSIDFVVQFAELDAEKTLTVEIYQADDSSGTNAAKLAEATFTAPSAITAGGRAIASINPAGDSKPYYAVKLQHDQGAAVVCGVLALCREIYLPPDAGWVLQA